MKREMGVGRCGLACALCSHNENCAGCDAEECESASWCENRKCSMEKNIRFCHECPEDCHKGLLERVKPYGFRLFLKRYGVEELLDCLEKREKEGVIYHREGIRGDYDTFDDVEELIHFIKTGERK